MARPGISYEQTAAAADALVSRGLEPTIRVVREALGTGSPNTLHAHLTRWRAQQSPAVSPAVELPAALVRCWSDALSAAVEAGRADLQQALEAARAEALELAAAGVALEREQEVLDARLAELTRERDQAVGRADAQVSELERLRFDLGMERAARRTADEERMMAAAQVAELAARLADLVAAGAAGAPGAGAGAVPVRKSRKPAPATGVAS